MQVDGDVNDVDDAAGGASAVRRPLGNPLLGRSRRRIIAAFAYLVAVVALFATRYAGRVLTLDGLPLEAHTPAFDGVSAVLIAAVTATVLVAPFAYAIWNGGPLLSYALPVVPVAVPEIVAGRYVLELDWVIALTAGAAAAAVAQYWTDVRAAGAWRPWRAGPIDEDALLVVTACGVVSAALAWQFVAAAPASITRRYAPFAALFAVPAAVVGRYWIAWLRHADRSPTV